MTQRQSNSYEQLERTLDEFPPKHRIATHMAINGQEVTPAAVMRELTNLTLAAEAFKVNITTVYDEVENEALVVLEGPAGYVGDLAAFMAAPRAASAR